MSIDRVNISDGNTNILYYPLANTDLEMPTRGRYPEEYPVGAVIHYTAGQSKKGYVDAKNTVNFGKRMGHCYFCISSDGDIFQTAPLSHWGYHAGRSSYPNLGENLSDQLVGIEVCCAGKLSKYGDEYRSWFQKSFSKDEVRDITDDCNYPNSGFFHKFTAEQEEALTSLLLWLRHNNPDIFTFDCVLGHDEISNRKSDPGGSLSYSMEDYRTILQDEYNNYVVVGD